MAMIVRSPYSGQPVKVRDQDLGRAIRDEEGRIFYVLPRSDGKGHYAAPTRKGSEQDEQRYLDLERKVAEQGEPVVAAAAQPPVHDATGPGRPVKPKRVAVLVALIVILLALLAALFLLPAELSPFEDVPTVPEPEQVDPVDEPTAWRFGDDPFGPAPDDLDALRSRGQSGALRAPSGFTEAGSNRTSCVFVIVADSRLHFALL